MEYKTKQENTYNTFLRNIYNSGLKDKIKINRGFSDQELVKFKDIVIPSNLLKQEIELMIEGQHYHN